MLGMLSLICEKPLFADQCTLNRFRLSYARFLVEMDIGGEFPDRITLEDKEGERFKQKVIYQWRPQKCFECNKIGIKE